MSKYLLSVVFLMSLLSSCNFVDELRTFNIDYSIDIVIPKESIISLPINLISPTTETNSNVKFSENNTAANLVEEIKMKEMVLTVSVPENGNLDFLESIQLFISTPNLPEIEIASNSDVIPNGINFLKLQVSTADLTEYIKAESFNIKMKATKDGSVKSETTIQADLVVRVKAGIL